MRRTLPLTAILSMLAIGCIDTDAAVFVEPSIESMTGAVQGGPLGSELSGSFVLKLHLGPRATDSSDVTINQFSLTTVDRSATVYSPLKVTLDKPSPVTVGIDSDVLVNVTFPGGENFITDMATIDALCDPAGVSVSGQLDDSLRGQSIPVHSGAFQPTCP